VDERCLLFPHCRGGPQTLKVQKDIIVRLDEVIKKLI
jgi:hypothetical protein